METLVNIRQQVVLGGFADAVQSVAGFASLHTAITLLVALMVQYTVQSRVLRIVFWVNFGLTVLATIYFGWHYIADDVAGVMIALVAFYVGGVASGQKFERHGLASPSHRRLRRPSRSSRTERRTRGSPVRLAALDGVSSGQTHGSTAPPAELHCCSSSRRHAGDW